MRIALSSRGSRGDVYPLLAIGAELKRRGHTVRVCAPPLFLEEARAVDPDPLVYAEDSEEVMRQFDQGWRAAKVALDWFARSIDEQFERLRELSCDAAVLVTSANELGAFSVAESRGIPHYRVAYAPILPGPQPPPLVPWQHLPRALNRFMFWSINRALELFFGRRINRNRRRLGLGPTGEIGQHIAGGAHTLFAINATLGPPVVEWQNGYTYTGYCFGGDEGTLSPELEAFLQAGPPPLYLGFGSVNVPSKDDFTERVLRAVERAGIRAVLAQGWTGLGRTSTPLSSAVFLAGDTPHATLFPRMAAVAHHGGSGTLHNAARAGVPQFVMPQIADQYYWGERVHRLGLGPHPHPPLRLTPDRLARVFETLATRAAYRRRAEDLATEVRAEDGVRRAADRIEQASHLRWN